MILVTGGAGFIGSHTMLNLAKAGFECVALDNLCKGHKSALRGAPLIEVDLRDKEQLSSVFQGLKIEAVIHFAALSEVGESTREPALYYDNNVIGTFNLLDAMRLKGIDKIVFSSTAAVYGEPQQVPIPEIHTLLPTNPYGQTKLAIENMLQCYSASYGMNSVSLRYFNAAGSDPNNLLGEDHNPETHLIPRVLQWMRGASQFQIFGDDYPTPDGTCIRDYVHVMDLADAHILALNYLLKGGKTEQFNLGTGQGFSVQEVVNVANQVTGLNLIPQVSGRRGGDPAVLVADGTKARRELGWNPRFTHLPEMIEHAWNWQLSHPKGYQD